VAAKQTAEKELLMEAAVEHMKQLAPKAKVKKGSAPDSLSEKLQKACSCHKKLALGLHTDKCFLAPANLKCALMTAKVQRESLAKQLQKTTLTPKQQMHVLDDFYGPSAATSSSGASSSKGWLGPIREPCFLFFAATLDGPYAAP